VGPLIRRTRGADARAVPVARCARLPDEEDSVKPPEMRPQASAAGPRSLALRSALLAAAALLACSVFAASASAVIVTLHSGATLSYQPAPGAGAQGSASPRAHQFDSFFKNLDYNGGPVMSSNTNYAVYWRPSGAPAYPAGYQAGVNLFFEDLAHDSGGHENVDSVAAQYNDLAGEFANYNSRFGGALIDGDPYPANGCTRAPKCLSDKQLRSELKAFVTSHKLPIDRTHEYFLLTPEGVEDCFEEGEAKQCSANVTNVESRVYCAYHGDIPPSEGGPLIYANDPFVNGKNCDPGNHPNGSSDSVLIGGLSHEHIESLTDPEPNSAWADLVSGEATGYEIGDKCRTEFGEVLGKAENGAKYNQVINHHLYWYQQEWSNQGHACKQRLTLSGPEPVATFSTTPGAGTELRFDASASSAPGGISRYSWQFGDGSEPQETSTATVSHVFTEPGRHLVALTVYGADGTSIGCAGIVETGDESPLAAFSPISPTAGRAASFDASVARDGDGSIVAYEWNFGDGSSAIGRSPSHTYASVGSYVVTLLAEDSSGQITETSRTVIVDDAPTAAPSLTTPGPVAGAAVSFDGSASSDPDGSIASYSWNFGDGSPAGSGVRPSHTYAAGGTYALTLTVTDNEGRSASAPYSLSVAGVPKVARAAPSSAFTTIATSVNRKTGAITFTELVESPGSFSWLSTFQNGKFGVFAARVRCRAGLIALNRRCRPSRVLYAKGGEVVAAAGVVTFTVYPGAAALNALRSARKHRRGLPVSVTVTYHASPGGFPVSQLWSVSVRRRNRPFTKLRLR
jgi:PKD repeat protein